MRSPKLVTLTFLGSVLPILGFWTLSPSAELQAGGNSYTVLSDADGDGLDDALEGRLHTSLQSSDTDSDGVTDLEEVILGMDPKSVGTLTPSPVRKVYLNAYQVGNDVIMQLAALHQSQVTQIEFIWGGAEKMVYTRPGQIGHLLVDTNVLPSSFSGWKISTARYRFRAGLFEQLGSVALGWRAALDNSAISASVVSLSHMEDLLTQVEFRNISSNASSGDPAAPGSSSFDIDWEENGGGGGHQGGSTGGGITPVDPNGGQPPEGRADEICVQMMAPTANLGDGRVEYTVTSANCEPEVEAVCLPGCSASVGDTIITIDPVGLIGG